jgi:hypothetical protein
MMKAEQLQFLHKLPMGDTMKSALIAVVAALATSLIVLQLTNQTQETDQPENAAPITLSFTEELQQDAWLRGINRDGSPRPGPADDEKPLVDASNSMCFLTKVEIQGMDGAEDTASCEISIDEFTNWWQVHAIQGDGTDASVACNARCVIWE